MANEIHRLNRPTLILAPNKTLTARLYNEMKNFFPENAVEYLVSYYDYFQPEVYIPGIDRFVQKDSAINAQLERLRLSTTKSLLERRDAIVVGSVSSMYGLGDPKDYRAIQVPLSVGMKLEPDDLVQRWGRLSYAESKQKFKRGTHRVGGSIIDIFPADSDYKVIRVHFANGAVKDLEWIYSATENQLSHLYQYLVSLKTRFAPSASQVEADRLYERISNDIEMMREMSIISCGWPRWLLVHDRIQKRPEGLPSGLFHF